MRITLASDHAGFTLKETIRKHLIDAGYDVIDCGTASAERVDYPDFGIKAAQAVSEGTSGRAILVCGSGIGMCMVANKMKGVRAAVLRDEMDATLSRQHNDANVACLGERVTNASVAVKLVDRFLDTPFEGGRHESRVKKIG